MTRKTARRKTTRAKVAKKGRPSWNPAAMLDVVNPTPGFRHRWVDKDPANVQKKIAEGWVMANEINGHTAEHEHPDKMGDGAPLTSAKEYRELVLMAIPEETAQARDEFYREKTEQQTAGLKRNLQQDIDETGVSGVEATFGKIVID